MTTILVKNMDILLYAGNLICFCLISRHSPLKRSNLALSALPYTLQSLLKFLIYSKIMLSVSNIIMLGIQGQTNGSLLMTGLRILFAESLILLFFLGEQFFTVRSDSRNAYSTVKASEAPYTAQSFGSAPMTTELFNACLLCLLCLLLLYLSLLRPVADPTLPKELALMTVHLVLLGVISLLFHRIEQTIQLNQEKYALDRQKQKEADYLQNVDIQYQRTRELWHDLKNHISVLQILAQEEKLQELTSYLVSFRQDVEARMIPTKTGNSAVDALLSDKLYHASRKDISLSLELCSLSGLQMNPADLCAILGNLIDNALEACEQLPENRQIWLNLKQQEGFFYLNISNTALPPAQSGQEGTRLSSGSAAGLSRLKTTKSGMDNGVGHGLGLRSVERIAHEYGGSLVTDYHESIFTVILRWEAQ